MQIFSVPVEDVYIFVRHRDVYMQSPTGFYRVEHINQYLLGNTYMYYILLENGFDEVYRQNDLVTIQVR